MIAELLDLANRLGIPAPRAFEPMPVHYFIELDGEGKVLGITPVCGKTKATNKSAESDLGKMIDCPVYFPLKLKDCEVQAAGGGGISVAEAGHGDVREVFCTEVKAPKGRPPEIAVIKRPTGGQVAEPEPEEETGDQENGENPSELDDDSGSSGGTRKNQYYRHDGWLKRIEGFTKKHPGSEVSKALKGFVDAEYRLRDPEIIECFSLADPAQAEADARTADEKKKAREIATKGRNAQLKQIAGARFTFRVNGQVLLKSPDSRNGGSQPMPRNETKYWTTFPMATTASHCNPTKVARS